MNYTQFSYIYPPRPTNAVHPESLVDFDDDTFMAEPKLNGDCAVIFSNKNEIKIRNRHKAEFSKDIEGLYKLAKKIHKGKGWIVVVGEWMAKSKQDANGNNFNGNFVLFDLLVYSGVHLLDYSFAERHKMLVELYKAYEEHDGFILKTTTPNLYVAKSFTDDFLNVYEQLVSIDMYEDLVLKKKNAKLELGVGEKNNTKTQIKFRKPAKNYHY